MRSDIDTLLISDSVFIHSCVSLMPYKIMFDVDLRLYLRPVTMIKRKCRRYVYRMSVSKDFSTSQLTILFLEIILLKKQFSKCNTFVFLFLNDITIVINQNILRHCFAKKGYFIACPNGTLEVVSSISFA